LSCLFEVVVQKSGRLYVTDCLSVSPSSLTNRDRGLLAEGRVRHHHVGVRGRLVAQCVVGLDRGLSGVVVRPHAVQEEVHGAQASDSVHDLDAPQRLVLQVRLLVAVELGAGRQPGVGRQQEAPGAAGRVDDHLSRLRLKAIDDRRDEGPRREVLAGPTLDVLGVALQEALVGVPLHVRGHRHPVFLADQLDDELAQLGRVLDLVLGLPEDEA